jgi:hypothetical protein
MDQSSQQQPTRGKDITTSHFQNVDPLNNKL